MYRVIGTVEEGGLPSKYAVFDVDNTLIQPKRGKVVSLDRTDWTFRFEDVPTRLRQLHQQGFKIVFRTDQTRAFKLELIQDVVNQIDLPILQLIAIDKSYHKPDTRLFVSIISSFNSQDSFYVGDAAGRKHDWSDVDKQFAQNIGLKFYTPEEFFETMIPASSTSPSSLVRDRPEVVIMVGIPASGKSRVVRDHFKPTQQHHGLPHYHIFSSDELGIRHPVKLAQLADQAYNQGARQFVFDQTNVTKSHRAFYRQFALDHGLECRILYVKTDITSALLRNKLRTESGEANVPDIAIRILDQRLEPPTADEGCTLVVIDNRANSRIGHPRTMTSQESGQSLETVDRTRHDGYFPKGFSPMLMENWKRFGSSIDPTGWYAAIKYDGIRCIYWEGKLITRRNHLIHAPERWKRWLPTTPGLMLDGELWTTRGKLHEISGVVRRKEPADEDWVDMKFMVFDLPLDRDPYERVYPKIIKIVNQACSQTNGGRGCPLYAVEQTVIQSREHLMRLFREEVDKGGEGLIVRNPRSAYEFRRSKHVLKMKQIEDDDAVVVGYRKGTGKNKNRLGALVCKWVKSVVTAPGAMIEVGSGNFTDDQRERYLEVFPLGTIIIVEHMGINPENGQPRSAMFKGIRVD